MKRSFCLPTLLSVVILISGCHSEPPNYSIWIDSSTYSQELIESSIKRFSEAKIDFIVDENGDVLINDKDIDKAVNCCS